MRRLELSNLPEDLNVARAYAVRGNTEYKVEHLGKDGVDGYTTIQFIEGGRFSDNCVPGILDAQLVEVLIDRLKAFKEEFNSTDSDHAITYLELALLHMNKRTTDRAAANTLGNNGEDYNKEV